MLNNSHSFLTYLNYLSKFTHINNYIQNHTFHHTAKTLILNKQTPTLQIKNINLTQYTNKLITHFTNPTLKHKT